MSKPSGTRKRRSQPQSSIDSSAEQILERIEALQNGIATQLGDESVRPLSHPEFAAGIEELGSRVAEALCRQSEAISQISESISELTSSVAANQTGFEDAFSTNSGSASASTDSQHAVEREPVADTVSGSESAGQSWDDIKNTFLNDKTVPETLPTSEECNAVVEESEIDEPVELSFEPYAHQDLLEMTEDELRGALIDQERFLSTVVQQLQRKSRAQQTLSVEQLRVLKDDLPDNLSLRVDESLKAVDQQVRLGELELSLERARVSRQLSNLDETRNRLESNARTLGLTIGPDGQIEGSIVANGKGSKGRRWLGVLGFGD